MVKIIKPADRAEWLKHRKAFLTTASRVACLLTPHPYASARQEYDVAVGAKERPEADIDPDLQDIGDDAEHVMLLRLHRMVTGIPPMRKNEDIYVHPKLPLGGTPDFLNVNGVPSENWQGKCVDPGVFRSQWMDGPPLHILIQHQCEYLLTGARNGGVIVLVRDRQWSTYTFPVKAHPEMMRSIELAVADLQRRVKLKKPPTIKSLADAAWVLSQQDMPTKKKGIDLSGSNSYQDAAMRYIEADLAEKQAKERKEVAKAEIAELMGDADYATANGFVAIRIGVKGSEDRVITADQVGTVVKGRAGHVRYNIHHEE